MTQLWSDLGHRRVAPVGLLRVVVAVRDVDPGELEVVDPREVALGMLGREPS
jgi:hypothetical protein